MNRFISIFWLITLGLWLVGCDLSRGDQAAGDISPPLSPTGVVVAQNGAVVRLEPATSQLELNATQRVEIRIDNVTDLTAADIELEFDPAVLQVQDADSGREGIQIEPGNFPAPDFVATNVVTNTSGVIEYAVVQIPPSQPVSGSGLLAAITFQAVAPGTSDLSFIRTDLANSLAQPIPVSSQPGQIGVGGAGPTLTPVLTNTPLPGEPTATLSPGVSPTSTIMPIPTTPVPATPIPATPIPTLPPALTPTAISPPIPPQVYIPPDATLGFCYRIQFGDTLENLAQKCGDDPRFCGIPDPGFINLANDLYPPGHIYPQKVLFIPTAYGNGPNIYLVQPGDTLTGIAEQCQMKEDLLAYVNGLPKAAPLVEGWALIIPRPPYAPPSRYPYPQVGPPSVWPPPCSGNCY